MSGDLVTHAGPPSGNAAGELGAVTLPRLLPPSFDGAPTALREHLARHGELPLVGGRGRSAGSLVDEVGRAGLTGRGGAAFPTARKLAAVMAAAGRPVVVVNGTEGEPGSAKDKVLLATAPHLVLDGAEVAARVVGSSKVYFVAHAAVAETVAEAVAERQAAGLDEVPVVVVPAADGFVAGEARAVVNWVANGKPVPTSGSHRLAERGLDNRPTLVQNAETLGHLALIARHGADWFRAVGTPDEPGSMLVTIIGAVVQPSVHEIELGMPVGDALTLAGGPSLPLSAVLIGGYFGTWAPWSAAAGLPYSAAGLAAVHASPGAGLIAALPAAACGLAETARLADYLAGESAGQCGPCVFGLSAIAAELDAIAIGRSAGTGLVHRWLAQVDGRGACAHPDGVVRMIRSALDVFSSELALHAEGWCNGSGAQQVLPVPPRRRLCAPASSCASIGSDATDLACAPKWRLS